MSTVDRRLAVGGYGDLRGDLEPYNPRWSWTGPMSMEHLRALVISQHRTIEQLKRRVSGLEQQMELVAEGRIGMLQAENAAVKIRFPQPTRLPPPAPGTAEQPKSLTFSGSVTQRIETGTEVLAGWTANVIDNDKLGLASGVLTVNDAAALSFHVSGTASPALDLITQLPIAVLGALEIRIERLNGASWVTIPNGAVKYSTPLQITDYPVVRTVGFSTTASAQFRLVAEVSGLSNAVELRGLEWGVLVAPPPAAA